MSKAKTLTADQLDALVARLKPQKRALVLLGHGAGLRAQSIAGLTWDMLVDVDGNLTNTIDLPNKCLKGARGGGRLPMSEKLFDALMVLWQRAGKPRSGAVIRDENGQALSSHAVVQRLNRIYARFGFEGCSSHTGRRTYATRLLREQQVSLADLQSLMRHVRPSTTLTYCDPSDDDKLVSAVAGL